MGVLLLVESPPGSCDTISDNTVPYAVRTSCAEISSPCATISENTIYTVLGIPYTHDLCVRECFQAQVTKYCGCVWMDTAPVFRTCGLEEFLNCANNL
jgi:hypothetical protein